MSSYYLPLVYENTGRGERQWDIFSRLLKDRIVFIGTPIDDGVANAVIAPVSANGTVCIYALNDTDVVVDINGWIGAGQPG